MEKLSIIGLDLAKRSFQAHGANADGGVAFRKKLSREKVLAFLGEQSPHTNRFLGSATVTHPFHRLRGQTFEVLKVRRLSGQESLSLRHPERGTFAMLRNWTDWAPPGASPSPGHESLLIDAFGLVQLAELVACLKLGNEGLDR
jgi:Family of unknown function (DUF5372)